MSAARSGRRAAATLDRRRMGERLRALRKQRRLTLKELAARSKVALSTLSKIELGQVAASYEKFAAVARALEVDIAALFDPAADAERALPAKPLVVRATLAGAPQHQSPQVRYRLLAGAYPAKRMQPMHGTIVARRLEDFPAYERHAGQEFITVLAGRIRICFESGESLELGRWDSAYFDSGVGHVYLSLGRSEAQVVVVMSDG